MYCPMKFNSKTLDQLGFVADSIGEIDKPCQCEKEKCAWWMVYSEKCSIKEISLHTGEINIAIREIVERM